MEPQVFKEGDRIQRRGWFDPEWRFAVEARVVHGPFYRRGEFRPSGDCYHIEQFDKRGRSRCMVLNVPVTFIRHSPNAGKPWRRKASH